MGSSYSRKVHHLSGHHSPAQAPIPRRWGWMCKIPFIYFHYAHWFTTKRLARLWYSSVRVPRRVKRLQRWVWIASYCLSTVPNGGKCKHPPCKKPVRSNLTISCNFDSLFKVLFIFPSQYLFAIGLPQIFSLGRSLPPIRTAIPNSTTLWKRPV